MTPIQTQSQVWRLSQSVKHMVVTMEGMTVQSDIGGLIVHLELARVTSPYERRHQGSMSMMVRNSRKECEHLKSHER